MIFEQQIIDFTTQHKDFTKAIVILCLTGLSYIIYKNIIAKFFKKIIDSTTTHFDDELYPLFNRLISIFIWFIGIGYILIEVGVNIKMLLSTIGASSILIAYACKDSLNNIASGIILMADRPFRKDDYIKLPSGEDTRVLHIGLRRSKFVNEEDKNIIIVPNVDLVKNKIRNYTYYDELVEEEKQDEI